jgi:hypothetical protein
MCGPLVYDNADYAPSMRSCGAKSLPAYKNDSSDTVAQPDNAAVASNTAAINARDIPLIELRFMAHSFITPGLSQQPPVAA